MGNWETDDGELDGHCTATPTVAQSSRSASAIPCEAVLRALCQ